MTPDREQLLDELARCFMRAAVDELLKGPLEDGAESGQELRRQEIHRGNDSPDPSARAS